jgi:hypothetical protein
MKNAFLSISILLTSIVVACTASALPTGSCSAAITIIDRIGALQAKIDHKLETGDTEGLRSLYAALQTRIRLAKSVGVDISANENARSSRLSVERELLRIEQENEREAQGALSFTERSREPLPPGLNLQGTALSDDLSLLSTSVEKDSSEVIELRTGKVVLRSINAKERWVLSPNMKFAAILENDGTIAVHSTETGSIFHVDRWTEATFPTGHQIAVDDFGTLLATNREGKWLIKYGSGGPSYSDLILAVRTLKLDNFWFGPNTKNFFGLKYGRHIESWDIRTGTNRNLPNHYSTSIKISSDESGALRILGRTLVLFDRANHMLRTWEFVYPDEVISVTGSRDLSQVYIATKDHLFYFDLNSDVPEKIDISDRIRAMSFDDATQTLTTVDGRFIRTYR